MSTMNNENKINHTIEAEVIFNKFSHDFTEDYEINEKTAWVADILKEMHDQLDPEDIYPTGSLNVTLEITRKKNSHLGDHLIVRANIDARYHLPCGLSLVPVAQHMEHSVNAAFLHDSMEKFPEYVEATTVFADNEEMELYFIRKGKVDIKEFINEQIFLEVPAFPRSENAVSINSIDE